MRSRRDANVGGAICKRRSRVGRSLSVERRSRKGRSCTRSRRDAVEWRKGPVNDPESAVPEGCKPAWANEKKAIPCWAFLVCGKGDPVMGVPVSDPGGMLLNGARAPSMIQRVQSRRDASRLGLMSMCEKEAIPNWAFLHAIPVGRCEL